MGQAEDEAQKQEVIAGYVAARDRLDAAMNGLGPGTPCGGWSVVEIAAHIAAWEQYSAELMASLAKGSAKPAIDIEKMNSAVAAEARKVPPDQTMAMYAEARGVFVDSLMELPAAAFGLEPVRREVEIERDHELEHAAELAALKAG